MLNVGMQTIQETVNSLNYFHFYCRVLAGLYWPFSLFLLEAVSQASV